MPDSEPPVLEQPFPVEELRELPDPMARALGEAGIGGARIHELFQQAVRVQCVGCGIALSGEELSHLPVAGGAASAEGRRLERVRLGFCARNGCTSRFYTLKLQSVAGIDWPRIVARTKELMVSPEASRDADLDAAETVKPLSVAGVKRWWRGLEARRRLQFMALAGVLLLFLVVRWYQNGARIPLISPKAREFIVGPGDGDPVPPGPAGKGAQTNAPRTFIVR